MQGQPPNLRLETTPSQCAPEPPQARCLHAFKDTGCSCALLQGLTSCPPEEADNTGLVQTVIPGIAPEGQTLPSVKEQSLLGVFTVLWAQESRLSSRCCPARLSISNTCPCCLHSSQDLRASCSLPGLPQKSPWISLRVPKIEGEGTFDLHGFSLGNPIPSSFADLRRNQITDEIWPLSCQVFPSFGPAPRPSALMHSIFMRAL